MAEAALKTVPTPDLKTMKAKIDEISNGIIKLKQHKDVLLEKQRASRENLRNVAKTIAGEKADAIIAGNMESVDALRDALQQSKDAAQGIAEDIDACNQGVETRKAEVGLLKSAYRNAYRAAEHALIGGKLDKAKQQLLKQLVEVLAMASIDIGTMISTEGLMTQITDGKSHLMNLTQERMKEIRSSIGASPL